MMMWQREATLEKREESMKKMEMMMFATGNIYRETGTASKYIEDREHSERMRSETAESMV